MKEILLQNLKPVNLFVLAHLLGVINCQKKSMELTVCVGVTLRSDDYEGKVKISNIAHKPTIRFDNLDFLKPEFKKITNINMNYISY